ncbi:MAG: (2Fe-2S)-binding protein [Gemmatimonadaceae bacterium]
MSDAPRLSVTVDGVPIAVASGTSIAALLANAGLSARRSVTGEVRAALCGMGVCHECRVTIDGRAHQRACVTFVTEGMVIARDV